MSQLVNRRSLSAPGFRSESSNLGVPVPTLLSFRSNAVVPRLRQLVGDWCIFLDLRRERVGDSAPMTQTTSACLFVSSFTATLHVAPDRAGTSESLLVPFRAAELDGFVSSGRGDHHSDPMKHDSNENLRCRPVVWSANNCRCGAHSGSLMPVVRAPTKARGRTPMVPGG